MNRARIARGRHLAVQLVNEASLWVPGSLVNVVSGAGDQVGPTAAVTVLAAWAIVPAAIVSASLCRNVTSSHRIRTRATAWTTEARFHHRVRWAARVRG